MDDRLWMIGTIALLARVGMALLHGGASRSKNAATSFFRAFLETAVAILCFWAVGASILNGSTRLIIGYARPLEGAQCVQLAAILIGCGVVCGSVLERSRAIVGILGTVLLAGFISPLAWRWSWSPLAARWGLIDRAGAGFVHFAAAVVAVCAATIVRPRQGKYNVDGSTNVLVGHSVPTASLGVMLMLVAWIPYVVGCALLWGNQDGAPFEDFGRTSFSVLLGAAAATIAASLYSRRRFFKLDIHLVFAGTLGGLVSISAAPGLANSAAVAIGAVAGILVPFATVYLEQNWKLDDPGGAIAIHGVGGAWAMIAAALIGGGGIMQHALRLGAQITALAAIGLLSAGLASAVYLPLRWAGATRARETDEFDGLDLAEHDLNAYPDFQQTMIKSYHLREV